MKQALALGFPLKINVVVLKGINDSEILPFVEMALNHGIAVRFLEFMPLCGSAWNRELVMPVSQMRQRVARRYHLTEEPRGDAPAQSFQLSDGNRHARVGFIGPLSEPFCDSCSRMRLSADGSIQPCLFSQDRWEVHSLLGETTSDEAIAQRIREAVLQKSRGSQYATLAKSSAEASGASYLSAYRGKEKENPLIHNLGG
jgi:cyclic pyranopterin phosphate synthase